LSAARGDVDEHTRNEGHRDTDPVIEVVHRARELLDIHVCGWMNLGHDHHFFGARVHCAKRQDLFDCGVFFDDRVELLE